MIVVRREVETSAPRDAVAAYLADFTTTAQWDPHTASCTRVDAGPVAVGSEFDNVQRIGPLHPRFRYRVEQYEPGHRIVLTSRSSAVELTDTIRFADTGAGGTTVTYVAQLRPRGAARFGAPLLQLMMDRFADQAADGLRRALDGLPG